MRFCLCLYLRLSIFFLFVLTARAKTDDNLSAIVILMRHGQRVPDYTYPTDPYNESFWPANWGGITKVGIKKQFLFGQFLGHRYKNLLGQTYDENNIHVITSNKSRTITSATVTVQGMFSNCHAFLNKDLIKVNVLKSEDDNILQSNKLCPKLNFLLDEPSTEDEDKLYAYLRNCTQMSIYNSTQLFVLYRILSYEVQQNLTLPDWTKNVFPEILEEQSIRYMKSQTETTDRARLKVGPLWYLILSFLKNYISNPNNSAKVLLLVGHDAKLFYFLSTLGNFDYHIPSVSTGIVFELRSNNEKNKTGFYVDTYFKNDTDFIQINIRNCSLSCDFTEVLDNLQSLDISPSEWDMECKLVDTSNVKIAIVVIFIILLILCVICAVWYFYTRKKKGSVV